MVKVILVSVVLLASVAAAQEVELGALNAAQRTIGEIVAAEEEIEALMTLREIERFIGSAKTSRSPVAAYYWLQRAVELGSARASRMQDRLYATMSVEDRVAAREVVGDSGARIAAARERREDMTASDF